MTFHFQNESYQDMQYLLIQKKLVNKTCIMHRCPKANLFHFFHNFFNVDLKDFARKKSFEWSRNL